MTLGDLYEAVVAAIFETNDVTLPVQIGVVTGHLEDGTGYRVLEVERVAVDFAGSMRGPTAQSLTVYSQPILSTRVRRG